MLALSKQLKTREELVAEHYDAVAATLFSTSWYRDDNVERFIERNIPVFATSLLDLCSGPGVVARSILDRHPGLEYHMVDISEAACEMAASSYLSDPRVKVLQGNWLNPILSRQFKYDVIIVKNSLHLIFDLASKISLLRKVLKAAGRVIVVETVSPSIIANDFVREIFKVAGFNYKETFFTEHSLAKELGGVGLKRLRGSELFVDQQLVVSQWLNHKAVLRLRQQAIFSRIRQAGFNSKLASQMKFDGAPGSEDFCMLRRQFCSAFHF